METGEGRISNEERKRKGEENSDPGEGNGREGGKVMEEIVILKGDDIVTKALISLIWNCFC